MAEGYAYGPGEGPEPYVVTAVSADFVEPRYVGGNRVVAYANVVLGGQLALNGLLVTENGPGDLRVAYPSKHPPRAGERKERPKVRNLYYALTPELREEIWRAVKHSLDGRGAFTRAADGRWARDWRQDGRHNNDNDNQGGYKCRI